jgi:uncharacterized membrane protein YfcA
MRLLGVISVITFISSSYGAWLSLQAAKDTIQRHLSWRRWSRIRRRWFLGWCLFALICAGNALSGGYTALTGNVQGERWSLALFTPLMCLLFISQPCSVERIRTNPRLRGLRACGLTMLGGLSIFLAAKIKV